MCALRNELDSMIERTDGDDTLIGEKGVVAKNECVMTTGGEFHKRSLGMEGGGGGTGSDTACPRVARVEIGSLQIDQTTRSTKREKK